MADTQRSLRVDGKRRNILIVEDEMLNMEMLRMILGEEYELMCAENGTKALRILEEHADTLSLVLLDLNLPDMKGIDILRHIKRNAPTALLPVIVLTADQEAEVECLTQGAIDFIPKPYPRPEVVRARIWRTIQLSEDQDVISWTERDQLTGLYNRNYFYHYAHRFDIFYPDTETDAVMLNISHFHLLNERYGRAVGDEILRKIGAEIRKLVEEKGGVASRLGGDTFLVYCPHQEAYETILAGLQAAVDQDNYFRIRMGVYLRTDRSLEMERRFDRAKVAMDSIKKYSRSIALYDEALHQRETLNETLLEGFRAAIREKQFQVYYQPKFDVRQKEPVLSSAEALVRWKHPEMGMVSPGTFIPLFEENGLISDLDEYVWREAAASIRLWKEKLGRSIPVSVNVSRVDMYDQNLPEKMRQIAAENRLERGELHLEVTESAYTENGEQIIRIINQLRELGFHIEMDDFGSGYSSLNMITTLPIDTLKLDMQFVRTAFKERKDTRLLEAVIGLAKSLELPIIAEGVETAEQMFTLKTMGCDFIQGYYFSRPLPEEEFEAFISAHSGQGGEAEAEKKADLGGRFAHVAMHDALTGLYNRAAFQVLFRETDKQHIAVMLVSIDDYEPLCRALGKEAMDRAVMQVAEVMRSSFRSADEICRLKEDEFVIIMNRMTSALRGLARGKVEQMNSILQNPPAGQPAIHLSAGVAFSDRKHPRGNVYDDAASALAWVRENGQSEIGFFSLLDA